MSQATATPYTAAGPRPVLIRRPLYPSLTGAPTAFFAAALATDLAYWASAGVEWETFSIWLITAGLVVAFFVALAGLADVVGGRRHHALAPSLRQVFCDALAAVLALANAFVHSRDGYTAVIPTGIILSALTVLILVLARVGQRPLILTPPDTNAYAVKPLRGHGTVPTLGALLAFAAGIGAIVIFAGPLPPPMAAADQYGPNPLLPAPHQYLLPPMHVAATAPWGTAMPTVAAGLKIEALGTGFEHPRSVYVLPNGDVLVVEASGPQAPIHRPKDFIMGVVKSFAGASGHGGNRITLVRPAGPNTQAVRTTFLDHLNSPFGVALVGNDLYVADTDAILRYPYTDGETQITAPGTRFVDLPGGPIDHHWTKSLVASPDGTKLFVGIGSNSNIAENGMEVERGRAAIWEIDRTTGEHRVFAHGLRNPNGLQFEPATGKLWAVVNERDELGPNLVPDYLTSVKENAFYGWPYSYYGQHVDPRVMPQRPDLVAQATPPDYALSSHVAPLGMVFDTSPTLPAAYKGGAFVGEHGSWDRTPLNGYKVIFVPFTNGVPSGKPQDVVTGFLNGRNEARGRPVGLALDKSGALLVADDLGNTVWRVSGTAQPAS
jgi:glucose/arabinose dehydrogenase/uncharacterized membrane protein